MAMSDDMFKKTLISQMKLLNDNLKKLGAEISKNREEKKVSKYFKYPEGADADDDEQEKS